MTAPRLELKEVQINQEERAMVNKTMAFLKQATEYQSLDYTTGCIQNAEFACSYAMELKHYHAELGMMFINLFCTIPYSRPETLLKNLLLRAMALFDPQKDKIQQASFYTNLADLYAHKNNKNLLIETSQKLLEFLKQEKLNSNEKISLALFDLCNQLKRIHENELAKQLLIYAFELDKNGSSNYLDNAKYYDWNSVRECLDIFGKKMLMGNPYEKNVLALFATIQYFISRNNKFITKYLLLLGAAYDESSLSPKEKEFAEQCQSELSAFFESAAKIVMNNKTTVTFFQEFKLDLQKTAFLTFDDKSHLSKSNDTSIAIPYEILKKILFFSADKDMLEIPEKLILEVVREKFTKRKPSKYIKDSATLMVGQFRRNYEAELTPAQAKNKQTLLTTLLEERFNGDDIDTTSRNLYRYNFAYMGEKNIGLTEKNIRLLFAEIETSIKNLVEIAVHIARDKLTHDKNLLNKNYHFLREIIRELFAKKENAGLWTNDDVIKKCAEGLANCLISSSKPTKQTIHLTLQPILTNEFEKRTAESAVTFKQRMR